MPDFGLPRFWFRDGTLNIFTDGVAMTIRSWPDLEARRKPIGRGTWRPFTPPFRLVRPYRPPARAQPKPVPAPGGPAPRQLELDLGLPDPVAGKPFPGPSASLSPARQRKRAFDGFRFSLPKEVAARTEPFTSTQWPLLLLFRAEPRALEVCRSSPALTFGVANAAAFNDRLVFDPVELAAFLILRRQRDILGRLGFPATDGAARIVAKLAPESVHVETMLRLRDLLQDPDATKALSHLLSINTGVIELLAHRALREMCAPALLEEVAASPVEKYRAATADLVLDCLEMQRRLRVVERKAAVASHAQLQARHEAVAADYHKLIEKCRRNTQFPAPPLRGTEDIVPLCSEEELFEEGRLQRNCVGAYGDRVAKGDCFIYRVLHPERATLSIRLRPDGNWAVGQLLASCNRPVTPATAAAVRAWVGQFIVSA